MKIEIKTDENGRCKVFKINGKSCGRGITGYSISHDSCGIPIITLNVTCEELIYDCRNAEIKQETK